jgi:hypothetical protein
MNLGWGTNLDLILPRMRTLICSQIHSVWIDGINFFNQVLNVHDIHDVRQMNTHTTEPLVSEPSLVEMEIAIGKL